MPSPRPESGTPIAIPPGVALVPEDFRQKLEVIKRLTGLSWEGLATGHGGGQPAAVALAQAGAASRVPAPCWPWRASPCGCPAAWPCSWTRT